MLHPELENGLYKLRGRLSELLASVGADARKPQHMARQLRLDKSLTWKISKVISAAEPQVALQHVPGDAGVTRLLKAIEKAGGNLAACQRVTEALSEFHDAVNRHVGDKPTLELVVDAMPDSRGNRLTMSRKLAFRGNSAIWGVQAGKRINTAWVAPSREEPDMIDTCLVGGWVDFKRLRHDAKWVLFQRYVEAGAAARPNETPVDRSESLDGPMLLRDFCSPSMPPIHAIHEPGGVVYELGGTTVGNSGAFDCFFGSSVAGIGPRFSPTPDRGWFGASISAPVEVVQFDLLVHRDCQFVMNHKAQLFGRLGVNAPPTHDRDLLPIEPDRVELGRFPAIVDSHLVPRYAEMIAAVYDRVGWNPADFIGVRYLIEYPPFPSSLIVTFPLELAFANG